jgi:hypothetical protein
MVRRIRSYLALRASMRSPAKGLARRDDAYPLIAGLIQAERTPRLDRLSLQHLVIAMPYATQQQRPLLWDKASPVAFIKGRDRETN